MQKVIVLNNEAAIEELNTLLSDGNWRVSTVMPGGGSGAWLIIVSDLKTWDEIVSKTVQKSI